MAGATAQGGPGLAPPQEQQQAQPGMPAHMQGPPALTQPPGPPQHAPFGGYGQPAPGVNGKFNYMRFALRHADNRYQATVQCHHNRRLLQDLASLVPTMFADTLVVQLRHSLTAPTHIRTLQQFHVQRLPRDSITPSACQAIRFLTLAMNL